MVSITCHSQTCNSLGPLAQEREAKRNFRVENAEQLKTMRTIPSPNAEQQ